MGSLAFFGGSSAYCEWGRSLSRIELGNAPVSFQVRRGTVHFGCSTFAEDGHRLTRFVPPRYSISLSMPTILATAVIKSLMPMASHHNPEIGLRMKARERAFAFAHSESYLATSSVWPALACLGIRASLGCVLGAAEQNRSKTFQAVSKNLVNSTRSRSSAG